MGGILPPVATTVRAASALMHDRNRQLAAEQPAPLKLLSVARLFSCLIFTEKNGYSARCCNHHPLLFYCINSKFCVNVCQVEKRPDVVTMQFHRQMCVLSEQNQPPPNRKPTVKKTL